MRRRTASSSRSSIVDVKSKAGGVITQDAGRDRNARQPGRPHRPDRHARRQNNYDQANASLDAAQREADVAERTRSVTRICSRRASSPRRSTSSRGELRDGEFEPRDAPKPISISPSRRSTKRRCSAPQEGIDHHEERRRRHGDRLCHGSVSGGTTIVQMADLSIVRIRALFNETDIGNVHPGEPANVTVDAYPMGCGPIDVAHSSFRSARVSRLLLGERIKHWTATGRSLSCTE